MAKEKTKEENILDEIKSLKESMNILADSVTTLNRNGLTTSIPATEVDKVVNAAKQGVRQAATHVQLPAPDLSPQTDDIADAVATKVVSQMDDNLDNMISKKTVKIKVEHNHYHYNRMFCNWASSETNRKTMCVLAGIIAVLAIAMGVSSVTAVGWIAAIIISGPLAIGYYAVALKIFADEPIELPMLFDGFKNFTNSSYSTGLE